MREQDTEAARESLEVVARKIEEHAKRADDHVVTAAILVREARSRVEAGEAGAVTWFEWAPKNIKLSKSRLYELQRIAEAEDSEAELERLRRLTRERVKRHRDKKSEAKCDVEEERRTLIAWAKEAPIAEVKRVLGLIEEPHDAVLPVSIGESPRRDQREAA